MIRSSARRMPQVLAATLFSLAIAAPVCAQDAAPAPVAAAKAPAKTIELGDKVPSLLMLDPSDKVWSLQLTSKSKLEVEAGDAVINSTNKGALWVADGTFEGAGALRVAGGTTYLGRHDVRPTPQTFADGEGDPLPPFRVQAGKVRSGEKLFLNGGDVTLPPGIYNGGIFASGEGSVITMQPGTYVMNSGDFFVSGARLVGEGVTIVMGGAQPGAFWCATGAELELSPPSEGPMRDIVLIARAEGGRGLQFDGARGRMKGLVYSPDATASLSAGADVTLDRLFCSSLSLALSSKLRITGQSLTLQQPEDVDAIPGGEG